jgi:hypothetical protein
MGGRGYKGVDLPLHPPLFLHRDHWPDDVEVFSSVFPHLLCPHSLDPPPLARCEAWRTPTRCWSHPGRGPSKVAFGLRLQKPEGPVWETRLFDFEVDTSWSLPPSWSLSLLLEHCSALLQPPLDFSLHQALLRYWPKIHSPTLSSLHCPQLINMRLIGFPLLLLVTKCCCCLLGNWMV